MVLESEIVELLGPRSLHVRRESLDLSALKPGDIAGRTIVSAVSPGTETAAYRGDAPLRPMKVYPRVVGYCNVAEVLACGRDVGSVRAGDLVLTNQSHRSSFVCDENRVLSIVPRSVPPAEAATTYLFQLGYNALIKGGAQEGQAVAVVGLGTLGLATTAVARYLGLRVVAFSDQSLDRDALDAFGVEQLYSKTGGEAKAAVEGRVFEPAVDLVVSTSNEWSDWQLALALPRAGGTIAVLGFPGRNVPPPEFNPLSSQFFYDRQLRILACGFTPERGDQGAPGFNLRGNCERLLGWMEAGKLPAKRLIAATVPWRDVGAVYERMAGRERGLLSVALTW
jgi:threonine dehydrogenase-like Zn-dependent dehydrogenase